MGKGSKERPSNITKAEWDDNHDAINWCKHEWKEFPYRIERHKYYVACTRCGVRQDCKPHLGVRR